ncbi:MAG: HTTM domain-containing protein [Ginsengibacter sp.]
MPSYSNDDNSAAQPGVFRKLFFQVDNSSLILFRIIFGFLLFYQSISAIAKGVVYENFIQPPFTFTFIGFEFLQPLPGIGMYLYFGVLALLGLMIMAGAWYRFSIIAFTLLWLVIYLMQKSGYNNHYYLELLLCCLMIFMPANAGFSLDVKRKKVAEKYCCSQWIHWIFIAQVFIVYFFSATSKLLAPDWFSGKFLTIQFSLLSKSRLLGFIYGNHWFTIMISYGGFFFDLLIVPLLLWKKTRRYAFVLTCLFHLFNGFTFHIGVFPYLSIGLLIFFFEPERIRHLFFKNKSPVVCGDNYSGKYGASQKIYTCCLLIYLFFQIALPLRSLFFPGNVFWTDEGYRMSWKMMLRTKSGKIFFKVLDPVSGKVWNIDPSKKFTPSHVMVLSVSPDIIWQFAQRIKNEFATKGIRNVQVYAIDSVSLNRSVYQPLVNPGVDLAKVKWNSFRHSDWIMPFKEKP